MQLSSVRALKQELLSLPEGLVEHVVAAASFRPFAAAHEKADQAMNGIALGVAPSRGRDYKLAVRPQRSGPLISATLEQIQSVAHGEVDVQYIGNVVKLSAKRCSRANAAQAAYYRVRRRPLLIGSSISDVHKRFVSAGALGCFVVGRNAPHYIGVLTNNHVIANENKNSAGDIVVQPGTLDGGAPEDVIGELGRFVRLHTRATNFVDAAIGDLYEDVPYDAAQVGALGNLAGVGTVADLPPKARVFKVGRTTGQTEGRVTAFDVDNVSVEYDMATVRFDNQIEIEGSGNRSFSDSGDSGSLIVDEEVQAIGLLFAGGDKGGSNGRGLTYANPLQTVLDELRVDLEL